MSLLASLSLLASAAMPAAAADVTCIVDGWTDEQARWVWEAAYGEKSGPEGRLGEEFFTENLERCARAQGWSHDRQRVSAEFVQAEVQARREARGLLHDGVDVALLDDFFAAHAGELAPGKAGGITRDAVVEGLRTAGFPTDDSERLISALRYLRALAMRSDAVARFGVSG